MIFRKPLLLQLHVGRQVASAPLLSLEGPEVGEGRPPLPFNTALSQDCSLITRERVPRSFSPPPPNTFKAIPLDADLLYQPAPLANKKAGFLWVQYPYSSEHVSIVSVLFTPRNSDCSEIRTFILFLLILG